MSCKSVILASKSVKLVVSQSVSIPETILREAIPAIIVNLLPT